VKASQILREQGQSLWLDNITRGLLDSGQLQRHIDDYSVTGLTSNPSIFDKAVACGDYDDAIRERSRTGLSDEELFLELAIEDLRRAADAFLPIHERTDGVDGWVSLEVSPLLARDTYGRGPAGDHRVHRLRRARERHPAVLGRPVPVST
jgi:transaldolase